MLTLIVSITGSTYTMNNGEQLFQAVKNQDLEQVKQLLTQGADTNAQNSDGVSPLPLAKYHVNTEVTALLGNYKQLLEQVQTKPTQELLTHAIESGYYGLVKLLIAKNIQPTADNLKLAKQKYNQAQEHIYARIGRLLLQYLSVTQDKSIISKTGIVGTYNLDKNITQIIAQFLNEQTK